MLVIHCSDTPPTMDIGVDEIRSWHKARGWSDIGYHDVIRRDGSIEKDRDIEIIGAHAKGFNKNSIGLCLIGGKGMSGLPESNFTRHQWAALSDFVDATEKQYPGIEIVGHGTLPNANKTCPNFNVKSWKA